MKKYMSKIKRVTQTMGAFYILYKERKKDPEKYHSPSIVDIGDVYVEELNLYVFTTWKTPTRLTDIFQDNPDLLERISVKSKTGSSYYKYRIAQDVRVDYIKDSRLLQFYNELKTYV